MRILIIEDEPKAAAYLAQGLREAGFTADVARNAEEGLVAVQNVAYALIVCDVMLPTRDGFAVVAELRRSQHTMPVLFVTARDEVDARVRGLDVGADDYLVKPFAFAELLARVRALLRRTPTLVPDVYRVADLVCDPHRRRVERAGRRLELTAKEFSLLQLLLEHSGGVVSRTLIANRVWSMDFDIDANVIDVQVRRLRAKIEMEDETPLIHTVRGIGYVVEDRATSS